MYWILIYLLPTSIAAMDQFEFVDLLLNNHQFFAKERLGLAIKHLEKQGQYDRYNHWQVDFSAALSQLHKSKHKQDYTYYRDYPASTRQNRQKLALEAQKRFFSNGSTLTLSYGRSWPDKDEVLYDNQGYVKDVNTTEYLDSISLDWELPLLRNKAGVIEQKTYDVSVLNYQEGVLMLEETQEAFIEDKLEQFLTVVNYQAQQQLMSRKLTALNGCTPVSTTDQSLLNRVLVKTRLKQSEIDYRLQAEQVLLQGLISDFALDSVLVYKPMFVLIEDLDVYLQQHSRVLRRIRIEMQKNRRYRQSYRNQLQPELDFHLQLTRDQNAGNYTTYRRASNRHYEAELLFKQALGGDVDVQTSLSQYQLRAAQIELKYQNKFSELLAEARKLQTLIEQGEQQLVLYLAQLDPLQPFKGFECQGFNDLGSAIDELEAIESLQVDYLTQRHHLYQQQLAYDALIDRLLPKR